MAIMNLNDLRKRKREKLKRWIEKLDKTPSITIMQVGNDMASSVYVKKKVEVLESFGIRVEHMKYHGSITESLLMNEILNCNANGILLQLPLPGILRDKEQAIIDCIPAIKDVDQLTTYSKGRLVAGDISILPCTVQGIVDILEERFKNINGLEAKNIAIFGRSQLVGMPLSIALTHMNANPILLHSRSNVTPKILDRNTYNELDATVLAVGTRDFVKEGDMPKTDLIIDVGINRKENGKLCGDYTPTFTDSAYDYTSVPGGVGTLTTLNVLENLIKLYKKYN